MRCWTPWTPARLRALGMWMYTPTSLAPINPKLEDNYKTTLLPHAAVHGFEDELGEFR